MPLDFFFVYLAAECIPDPYDTEIAWMETTVRAVLPTETRTGFARFQTYGALLRSPFDDQGNDWRVTAYNYLHNGNIALQAESNAADALLAALLEFANTPADTLRVLTFLTEGDPINEDLCSTAITDAIVDYDVTVIVAVVGGPFTRSKYTCLVPDSSRYNSLILSLNDWSDASRNTLLARIHAETCSQPERTAAAQAMEAAALSFNAMAKNMEMDAASESLLQEVEEAAEEISSSQYTTALSVISLTLVGVLAFNYLTRAKTTAAKQASHTYGAL